ncbi:MAG: hypothetical protein Q8K32_10895 [Archangium sp.]|nr:hypothetical protein [Archangium sp.]
MRSALVIVAAFLIIACTGNVDCPQCAADSGSAGGEGGGSASGGGAGTGGGGGSAANLPAWRRDAGTHQWIEIPNTSGAGGAAIDAWGALAENKATGELYIAASGGHSDSSDNRVVSISLMNDAPAWVLRKAPSASVQTDVLYYADGLPTSRHLYQHLHYLPARNAVLLGGCRFGYGGGTPTGPGMDLFDLTTNEWLPRMTFPDITPFSAYAVEVDGEGRVWTSVGQRFDPASLMWSPPGTGPGLGRFPQATAPSRHAIFNLQYGDGQGYDLNLGVNARLLDTQTGNSVSITFNPSQALTELTTAQPNYAGMDYDAANDRFLFYSGVETGKVYVITPNAGTVWELSVLSVTGMPSVSVGAGINKRFRYLPTLGGFVLLTSRSSNLFFLTTSP